MMCHDLTKGQVSNIFYFSAKFRDQKIVATTLLTAMGSDFQATVAFLAAVADEQCCALCYYCYFKKFLDVDSRHALLSTAADCLCDWPEQSASSGAGTSESTDSTNTDDNEMESEAA